VPAASAQAKDDPPADTGKPGRRYVIRGGAVMTMDPSMPGKGEFADDRAPARPPDCGAYPLAIRHPADF